MPSPAPGPWLRLVAFTAACACAAAVVSGALELGAAHRALAALALPPLCALVAAAWIAHRRLLAPTVIALVAFLLAALVTPRPLHLAFAGLALAAALVAVAACFRGEPAPRAALRDYVTLTKPRIMSLLLLTGAAGMFVGAQGAPAARDVRRDDGRPRSGLRRRQRAQPRARPGHRPADASDRRPPRRGRADPAVTRARVRARAVRVLVRAARVEGERADGRARPGREPLLRARLHGVAEALDAAEHRHRRRCRGHPAARRLGGRDRTTWRCPRSSCS